MNLELRQTIPYSEFRIPHLRPWRIAQTQTISGEQKCLPLFCNSHPIQRSGWRENHQSGWWFQKALVMRRKRTSLVV